MQYWMLEAKKTCNYNYITSGVTKPGPTRASILKCLNKNLSTSCYSTKIYPTISYSHSSKSHIAASHTYQVVWPSWRMGRCRRDHYLNTRRIHVRRQIIAIIILNLGATTYFSAPSIAVDKQQQHSILLDGLELANNEADRERLVRLTLRRHRALTLRGIQQPGRLD